MLEYGEKGDHETKCHHRPYNCVVRGCEVSSDIEGLVAHHVSVHSSRTLNHTSTISEVFEVNISWHHWTIMEVLSLMKSQFLSLYFVQWAFLMVSAMPSSKHSRDWCVNGGWAIIQSDNVLALEGRFILLLGTFHFTHFEYWWWLDSHVKWHDCCTSQTPCNHFHLCRSLPLRRRHCSLATNAIGHWFTFAKGNTFSSILRSKSLLEGPTRRTSLWWGNP